MSNPEGNKTTYRGRPVDVLNRAMKIYIPETANNPYADYPMTNSRWCQPEDQIPYGPLKGEPCFIRTENYIPDGFKDAYVWGPGDRGWGYYNLLTRSAHQAVYVRLQNRKVTVDGSDDCFACFKSTDPRTILPKPTNGLTREDMDVIRLLFHARSVSSKGNDAVAVSDQIAEAQATASGLFVMEQGFAPEDLRTIGKAVDNQTIKR